VVRRSLPYREAMPASLTPAHLRDVWPDFDWDNRRVWALAVPATEIEVASLTWLLDEPLWSSRPPEPLFDLRPRDVLADPGAHPQHARRVREADLAWPLDLYPHGGRFVVLDGLHRLARLVMEGASHARVRCLPPEARVQILVDRSEPHSWPRSGGHVDSRKKTKRISSRRGAGVYGG